MGSVVEKNKKTESSELPSGKRLHNYGSPVLVGKSTILMAIFTSKLLVYQRLGSTQSRGYFSKIHVCTSGAKLTGFFW